MKTFIQKIPYVEVNVRVNERWEWQTMDPKGKLKPGDRLAPNDEDGLGIFHHIIVTAFSDTNEFEVAYVTSNPEATLPEEFREIPVWRLVGGGDFFDKPSFDLHNDRWL